MAVAYKGVPKRGLTAPIKGGSNLRGRKHRVRSSSEMYAPAHNRGAPLSRKDLQDAAKAVESDAGRRERSNAGAESYNVASPVHSMHLEGVAVRANDRAPARDLRPADQVRQGDGHEKVEDGCVVVSGEHMQACARDALTMASAESMPRGTAVGVADSSAPSATTSKPIVELLVEQ